MSLRPDNSERNAIILRRRAAGETHRAIAESMRLTVKAVTGVSARAHLRLERPAARSDAWSDERSDKLRKLVAEGHSYGVIAKMIGGVSRNAAIGRAKRLGLIRDKTALLVGRLTITRPSGRGSATTGGFPGQMAARLKARATPTPPPLPDRPAGGVRLLDLASHVCRWPIAFDVEHLFCGRMAPDGSPYCLGCVAEYKPYQPSKPHVRSDAPASGRRAA